MTKYELPTLEVPIKNLVIEGGGVKGAAFPPAIEALVKSGVLDSLEAVAGSSAGGIMAFLISMGKSPENISSIMNKIDFKDLIDREDPFWTESLGLGGEGIGLSAASPEKALTFLTARNKNDKLFGIYKGEVLKSIVQSILVEELGNPNATFADLAAARRVDPSKKDLILTGTNLSKQRLEYFCEKECPEMPIWKAVRITMSFPGAFEGVRHRPPDATDLESDSLYVDGGLANNFPVEYFDHEDYMPDGVDFTKTGANPSTLGLKVDSDHQIYGSHIKIDNLGEYLKTIKGSVTSEVEKLKKYKGHFVQINELNIKTLDFDLSKENKKRLSDSAKKAIAKWITERENSKVNFSLTAQEITKILPTKLAEIRFRCEQNEVNEIVALIDNTLPGFKDSKVYIDAIAEFQRISHDHEKQQSRNNRVDDKLSSADYAEKFEHLANEAQLQVEELEQEISAFTEILGIVDENVQYYEYLDEAFSHNYNSFEKQHSEVIALLNEHLPVLKPDEIARFTSEVLRDKVMELYQGHPHQSTILMGFSDLAFNYSQDREIPSLKTLKNISV